MDGVFILLGLVVLAIPVCVIYLLVSHSGLKARVAQLEARLAGSGPQQKAGAAPHIATWKKSVSKPAQPAAPPVQTQKPLEAAPAVAEGPHEAAPPAAFVFRKDRFDDVVSWLKSNWFYAIAAVSLALSGVFMVQYGVEKGLLTPFWRVMGALAMGATLVGAGEWLRRRGGDEEGDLTAFLPSTFAGAGIVVLFTGVLAAKQLYGLIGTETAFFGLATIGALAIVLGWFYGPMLACVGILGGTLAPFLVGGDSQTHDPLYYYFALIGVVGLGVDAVKRWAWVSSLALLLSFGAAWLLFMGSGGEAHFAAFALILAVAAAAIPPLCIRPSHDGAMVSASILRIGEKGNAWPEFPTRLASATFAAATSVAVVIAVEDRGTAEVWLALIALSVLFLMAVLWFRNAPALCDMTLWPPLALSFVVFTQAADYGSLYAAFREGLLREPETTAPVTVSILLIMAALGSILALWSSLRDAKYKHVWAVGAALFAPVTLIQLELLWRPEPVLGSALWAAHAMAVAVLMTIMAERLVRVDGSDRRRVAYFVLSAMTMVSFALILMLSSAALTLALAIMVLLAAWMDRKYDMRLLAVFVQVGGIVAGWRLVIEPGVLWAIDAPLWEVLLSYGGVVALFSATWITLRDRSRNGAIIVMESAIWSLSGVLFTVLLYRALDGVSDNGIFKYWGLSLYALVWLISAANQLYRLKAGGFLRVARIALAVLFGTFGVLLLLVASLPLNPLFERDLVRGPYILDTLFVAYALPALLFSGVAWKFSHLHRGLRIAFGAAGAALAALYMALEIRRYWQGDMLAGHGTTEGELYSYTVAMMIVSAGLLAIAFLRRSAVLRKIALIGIGLTIAKVFLIDMSGLAGLLRVVSFLALGLTLAGLAWINRWMTEQWERGEKG